MSYESEDYNFQNDRNNYEIDGFNYLLTSLNSINEENVQKQDEQNIKIEIYKIPQISEQQVQNNDIDWNLQDEYIISDQNQSPRNSVNKNSDNDYSSQDDYYSIQEDKKQKIEKPQITTEKIRITKQKKSSNNIIIVEQKKKKQQNQQVETKNLPNYFGRHILKRIQSKLQDEQNSITKSELKNKLDKYNRKKFQFTLNSLRNLLDESYCREEAIKYLTSFDFLDDLLQSDKQQDIKPQIKYVKRMYEGCLDREKLLQWKDS
ncbi:unnamed protein product [Paramecium pentaurelia]|uniref:Uncharacterized protein n=1 Tax=Paramecium pentaurelia TaxID=43138 RepID=A0A8S1X6F1_9CILI|nr:unnamed protein product [Paramecium pentaurelia]